MGLKKGVDVTPVAQKVCMDGQPVLRTIAGQRQMDTALGADLRRLTGRADLTSEAVCPRQLDSIAAD